MVFSKNNRIRALLALLIILLIYLCFRGLGLEDGSEKGASISSVLKSESKPYSLWTVDKFKPKPAVAIPIFPSPTRESISMDGIWDVRTDPKERGFDEQWYARQDIEFDKKLKVPGNWIIQGLGGEGIPKEETKYSDISMRSAKLTGSYLGLVWYKKEVEVPQEWEKKESQLVFGGVLSSVRLWVNGDFVGGRWTDGNSFYFNVTEEIKAGGTNIFVMAIDNRWAKTATVSHHQWYVASGGPFHHMVLRALPKIYIERALVRPALDRHASTGVAEVHVQVVNESDVRCDVGLDVLISSLQMEQRKYNGHDQFSVKKGATRDIVLPIKIFPVEVWSFEEANLYKIAVDLRCGDIHDHVADRFGMRTIDSIGNRVELNHKPFIILGQHFNFFWPNDLNPPITKNEYIRHLKVMQDYGFNYLRTPWLMPEECYQAADEIGMMLQLDFPYAYSPYNEIKLPLVKRLIEECLIAYGNHPSLVVLCMSNEWSWDNTASLNRQFCKFSKSIDPTRLVMDTDGIAPENVYDPQFFELVSLYNQTDNWAEYMSNISKKPSVCSKRPCIDHEFLNVPSLHDVKIVDGYRNPPVVTPPVELLDSFVELIREEGIEQEYPLYVKASHMHQANFIKEGIEKARRNPLKAGYSMCGWNDIETGVHWGILDAFLNTKEITADQMRSFNGQSVILVDFIDPVSDKVQHPTDYCRSSEQEFILQPFISHFGSERVRDAVLTLQILTKSGDILAEKDIRNISLSSYTMNPMPRTRIGPIRNDRPLEVTLRATLSSPAMSLENSWPMWFFPKIKKEIIGRKVFAGRRILQILQEIVREVEPAEGASSSDRTSLWVTEDGQEALDWLINGRNVMFIDKGEAVPNPFDPGWFKGDKHMGSIIRSNDIIGDFPHNGFASWQFRALINRTRDISHSTLSVRPVITSVINDSRPHIQHQIFIANTNTGGHLTYCMLKVLSRRCETDYLLYQLVKNAKRSGSDPVVDIEQIRPHLLVAARE